MPSMRYLGLEAADQPLVIRNTSAGLLTASMYSAGISELSGVHRAPCITSADTTPAITYPILGKRWQSFAGLAYGMRYLDMQAQLVPHVRTDSQTEYDDPVNISLRLVTENDTPNYIGSPVRCNTARDRVEEYTALASLKGLGYTALHLQLSPAVNFERTVELFGKSPDDGALHPLPFTSSNADILVERLEDALRNDLPTTRTPHYR